MSGGRDDGVLVGVAVAAAFAAGLVAIAQHACCTTAGYQLAVAQREGEELQRAAEQAERRVAQLSTVTAATARAAPMKLTRLSYPRSWNIVNAGTLRACLDGTAVPAPAPARGGRTR
jgi:hypothetical protein